MKDYFAERYGCGTCLETGYALTTHSGTEVLIRCPCKFGDQKKRSGVPPWNYDPNHRLELRELPREWFTPTVPALELLERWQRKVNFAKAYWVSRYFYGTVKI